MSKSVKLKLQIEKFPASSVTVKVIVVSLLITFPIGGNWEIIGLGSQLSKPLALYV